ncbi:Copper homeostasis protein CutC [uncultured Prevotella sp.]|uniref:copper homeostasis protein CutC n=1 Tax=uncultured Prevotella sp. TaxID=159272 RepID=UPI001A61BF6D|nr:copper homeostasis protein CutC [uncultured Prevotella sp.]VTY11792.1 Copper homeostasis protein CutC [uncultured Prevotella sp.]
MPILEVCTGSLQSVINAVKGGAQRIELCSALSLDGLTPSLGLIKTVRKMFPKLTIHTLIRVREGDFCYNEGEIKVMETDIKEILSYTDAIVCGALTADGDIDIATTRRLIDACEGKPFTFHRAFDVCRNPLKALDELAALHCTRVLTSGQAPTAETGIPALKEYVKHVEGRMTILPGGGVTPLNAKKILAETGATEIHGSASGVVESGRKETLTEVVAQILQQIK